MPGKAREIVAEWNADYRRVAVSLEPGLACVVKAPELMRAKVRIGERRACCVSQFNCLERFKGAGFARLSFVVRPHAQDAHRFLFDKDFIYEAVLDIDAARVGAGKVTNQFFEGRWILKRIPGQHREQFLRPWLEAAGNELLRILHRLPGKNNFPTHHLSVLELLARGSAMPALMDSRMPGTASRYKVS